MEADMVQVQRKPKGGNGIHRKVRVVVPGSSPLKGRKRTAASIRRQVATSARKRREALRAGRGYGSSPAPGGRRSPPVAARKLARKAGGPGVGDALVYLSHAKRKALGAVSRGERGDTLLELIGLLGLATAALEGRD